MKPITVPVPDYRIERVPVPSEYLARHCAGVLLSTAATYDQLEEQAARLWVCVQDHNRDKDYIEVLK